MIGQLSREVVAQTDEFAQLQKMVSQADAIRSTEKLLEEIDKELRNWADVFPPIARLITLETADSLRNEAELIRYHLASSQVEFAKQNLQQANKLTQIKTRVERLRNATKLEWTEYAKAQVIPYRELARIAERLPKMAHQLDAIRSYLVIAEKQATELPTKPEAVQQFQTYLGRLETLLSTLEGLPGEVKHFLDVLIRGNATFADVTRLVFDWCIEEGLTDKLQITFLK